MLTINTIIILLPLLLILLTNISLRSDAEKFREEFTRVQGLLEAKEDPLAQSIQTLTLEEEEENKVGTDQEVGVKWV